MLYPFYIAATFIFCQSPGRLFMDKKERWYEGSVEHVLSGLETRKEGLISQEAKKRNSTYGYNEFSKGKKDTSLTLLLKQFGSFVVWVLIAAAVISYFIGHHIEFWVISVIIIFVILISFFEEYKASKDMEALVMLSPRMSRVLRDNKKLLVFTKDLTIGDILVLERGDIVGADARLLSTNNLQADESPLTGEAATVLKATATLSGEVSLAQRSNMVFSGTHITNGNGLAAVVSIGDHSEIGKISQMIKGIEQEPTPLQKRLDKLAQQISFLAILLAMSVFAIGMSRGTDWTTMLVFSMAMIVSGIPESLPTVVAVTLAAGVKKMAKRNAIVKRLSAVETLGTCTIICSDKTGTLTQNKMVIERIYTADAEIVVTGEGYTPSGIFLKENFKIDARKHDTITKILEIGVFCNNADIKKDKHEWVVDGEATEGALVVLARKAGIQKAEYHRKYPRKKEHPFDPVRKCMSTVHLYKGKHFVYSKGAPELLLKKAKYYLKEGAIKNLTPKVRKQFLDRNKTFANLGLRVLGLAYKEHKGPMELENVENELIFVGIVSIRDPPKPAVKDSIKRCQDAGIKVVMITGDNEITAKAIAKELCIFTEGDRVMTGKELDRANEEALLHKINKTSVFARVTPAHKLRIVETLQHAGHVVAMTGDGVNDAPALKKADIGIAMGQRGTDVAKESAELILKDDNFTTIVNAVEEGRTIYENIRKFIYYLLVGNFSEVMIFFIAVLVGANLPLTALMILFLNLVTSELPAIGLSFEKPSEKIMRQRPRDAKEGILSDYLLLRVAELLPLLVLGTITLYIWELVVIKAPVAHAQTVAFATIIFFEIFHALNARSWDESLFSRKFFSNWYVLGGVFLASIFTLTVIYWAPLQAIFGTVPLSGSDWMPILFVSSMIIFFIEVQKTFLVAELKERSKMDLPKRQVQ
ncbi:MAG: Ca2+-transporting ATPase [archaeon GW2011_AR4]|nr:MAG: Ca2+-transporting ATPase [archaeon GW2011_AR4]